MSFLRSNVTLLFSSCIYQKLHTFSALVRTLHYWCVFMSCPPRSPCGHVTRLMNNCWPSVCRSPDSSSWSAARGWTGSGCAASGRCSPSCGVSGRSTAGYCHDRQHVCSAHHMITHHHIYTETYSYFSSTVKPSLYGSSFPPRNKKVIVTSESQSQKRASTSYLYIHILSTKIFFLYNKKICNKLEMM